MKDKEQSKAEEFLKKKLYKDNYESVGVYSMSSICVLFGTMVDVMQEYAEHYHAEKQRTDDRELREEIIQMKAIAESNRSKWNFPNEHYIEYTGVIRACDNMLKFIRGQIPAKEK